MELNIGLGSIFIKPFFQIAYQLAGRDPISRLCHGCWATMQANWSRYEMIGPGNGRGASFGPWKYDEKGSHFC